jgi:hypothetical protein
MWTWYEDFTTEPSQRFGFWSRLIKFSIWQCMLLCCVSFQFGNVGEYYFDECEKRNQCMTYCNEDYFPDIICIDTPYKFEYGGNKYSDLYFYPYSGTDNYDRCWGYMEDNSDYEDSPEDSSRQVRLHTCFQACKADEEGFENDTRPECTENLVNSMVCVHPDDDCEEVYVPNEVSTSTGFKWDPGYAFIAIAIFNVFQYLFNWLVIYTVQTRVESYDDIKYPAKKCGIELFTSILSGLVFVLACYQVTKVHIYGPTMALWGTYMLAFIFDQIKSLFFHLAIWYCLLRRCGYLKENEDQWLEPTWRNIQIDKSWDHWRMLVMKLLETRGLSILSTSILVLYAIFVLIVLSFTELFNNSRIPDYIDQGFICLFLLEIILNFFARGFSYYFDIFNFFDTAIVLVSFIMFFLGIAARGLAVLRLLRLVRLIVVLKKVSAKSNRKPNKKYVTALQEAVEILKATKQIKKLPLRQKKELQWAIEIIENYKLYEVTMNVQVEKGSGQAAQDLEARRWINLATPAANDPLTWFDRDLDDYLYERQRDQDPGEDKEVYEEDIRQAVNLPDRTHFQLEKVFDDIGKWRFNAFQYYELCGSQLVTYFTMRIFQLYDINRKFEIPTMSLKEFTTEIFNGYSANNPYHNAVHAVDVTHRLNYFILTGNLMKSISDLDIMAAIIAGIIHDFQHPGVNNDFLVKIQHKKAIRYNDYAVLERHHLAAAFAILLDQNCDITMNLHEDQFWVFRTTIIKMVLSTDIKKHEEVLGAFNNYKSVANFPNDDKEKNVLLNMALRLADNGNPLQPHDLYFKWMALYMEELYQQGDIEKHKGFELSCPFMDRTSTNPYACQLGYIEVIVEPLLDAWIQFLPDVKDDLVTRGLNENKELLRQKDLETMQIIFAEESALESDVSKRKKKGSIEMTQKSPRAVSSASNLIET